MSVASGGGRTAIANRWRYSMSDLVTLGIVKPDGSFTTTVTRHEFLLPAIMRPEFLSGDPAAISRLLRDEGSGHWYNHPAEDGYILIDSVQKRIFDWHDGRKLNLVDAEKLGFGSHAHPHGNKIREWLRPFIVGANYMHQKTMDTVEHQFEPCATDRQLRKLMDAIAYEGLGRTLLRKPALENLVTYEVAMSAWEYERLPYGELAGLISIREQVEARAALSEQDSEAWDAIHADMAYLSPMDEAWVAMEKLLYPNGIPGRKP